MDELPPERQKEMMQAINRMADKLVRLGYASKVACHDSTGKLQTLWTPRGLALQDEISRIFDSVNSGESLDFDQLQAFIILLAMKP